MPSKNTQENQGSLSSSLLAQEIWCLEITCQSGLVSDEKKDVRGLDSKNAEEAYENLALSTIYWQTSASSPGNKLTVR